MGGHSKLSKTQKLQTSLDLLSGRVARNKYAAVNTALAAVRKAFPPLVTWPLYPAPLHLWSEWDSYTDRSDAVCVKCGCSVRPGWAGCIGERPGPHQQRLISESDLPEGVEMPHIAAVYDRSWMEPF